MSENHYPAFWKRSFSVWQQNNTEEISKFAQHCVSDLARIDFRDKVVQAVVLFQEGLETTHIEVALLKFWTGIEVLCAREEKESTERTVEQASSIFGNQSHAAMRVPQLDRASRGGRRACASLRAMGQHLSRRSDHILLVQQT
jgi:hypothetical protein